MVILYCNSKVNDCDAGTGIFGVNDKAEALDIILRTRKETDNVYDGWRLVDDRLTCGWCIRYLLAHGKIKKTSLINYKKI